MCAAWFWAFMCALFCRGLCLGIYVCSLVLGIYVCSLVLGIYVCRPVSAHACVLYRVLLLSVFWGHFCVQPGYGHLCVQPGSLFRRRVRVRIRVAFAVVFVSVGVRVRLSHVSFRVGGRVRANVRLRVCVGDRSSSFLVLKRQILEFIRARVLPTP